MANATKQFLSVSLIVLKLSALSIYFIQLCDQNKTKTKIQRKNSGSVEDLKSYLVCEQKNAV
jgi:hypothetical protein